MCRAGGRRCPHSGNTGRDRRRRATNQEYRTKLTAHVRAFGGDEIAALIKTAPASALRPVSERLAVDPDTFTDTPLSRQRTHDPRRFLIEFDAQTGHLTDPDRFLEAVLIAPKTWENPAVAEHLLALGNREGRDIADELKSSIGPDHTLFRAVNDAARG